MFFRRLRLRNIRSIRELDISFQTGSGGRPWTYVLGENGTGKSSVLRAIGLAMAGGDATAELVGDPDDWIRLGTTEAAIAVDFATADDKPRHAELTFRRGQKLIDFLDANREALGQIDAPVAKSERNYFVVGYGVSRRAPGQTFSGPHAPSPFRTVRAQSLATLFWPDASLVSLEQWAMDQEYRRGSKGLDAVRTAFGTLLPDVEFGGIDRERRRLMFRTRDGDLPLAALSDGYQAMASWCGDMLFRITESFHDRRDPLKARGLLLIDELDLHLHPVWQRHLVAFLKKTLPNMQVVATTHSPLTVHQAGEGELYVLRRQGDDGARCIPYEGAPNRLLLHQLLQSPIFGLDTLDSPQVADMRDELRRLQGIGDAGVEFSDAASDRRIRDLRKRLAEVPNWRDVPPYLQRTNAVLEEVARQLTGPDEPNPVKAVSRRAGRKEPRR